MRPLEELESQKFKRESWRQKRTAKWDNRGRCFLYGRQAHLGQLLLSRTNKQETSSYLKLTRKKKVKLIQENFCQPIFKNDRKRSSLLVDAKNFEFQFLVIMTYEFVLTCYAFLLRQQVELNIVTPERRDH